MDYITKILICNNFRPNGNVFVQKLNGISILDDPYHGIPGLQDLRTFGNPERIHKPCFLRIGFSGNDTVASPCFNCTTTAAKLISQKNSLRKQSFGASNFVIVTKTLCILLQEDHQTILQNGVFHGNVL